MQASVALRAARIHVGLSEPSGRCWCGAQATRDHAVAANLREPLSMLERARLFQAVSAALSPVQK